MLIFDFDGVLMDSVREVTVTAFNAVTEKTITRTEQLPENLMSLFLRNRFQVQSIGEVIPLMEWCLANCTGTPQKVLTHEEYNEIIRKFDEPVLQRTNRIYAQRKKLVQKDRRAWMTLNKPFHPIWRRLATAAVEKIVLLTNKNREATVDLCCHFGLPVSAENIYSGDRGMTKIENMHRIMQRYERAAGYAFLDDSIKNLKDIEQQFLTGVALYLASWGYCGPDDAVLARQQGYRVITMADVTVIDGNPSIAGP